MVIIEAQKNEQLVSIIDHNQNGSNAYIYIHLIINVELHDHL